jgi:hypothetical protein
LLQGGAIKLGTSLAGEAAKLGVYTAYYGGDAAKGFDKMGGLTLNLANLGSFFDIFASGEARGNGTNQSSLGAIAQALSGTGLLEMNITTKGVTAQIGTGGIDVGGALYDLSKRMRDKAALERCSRWSLER